MLFDQFVTLITVLEQIVDHYLALLATRAKSPRVNTLLPDLVIRCAL
jgi:hypothetical protein